MPKSDSIRNSFRRFSPFYVVLFVFSIFLVFSNDYDWDHFFTTFEVDLRSWLIDHQPPVWSYQFCAGVTRIGDPQAFGLSPLFLPVILFGSFWGLKILMIACTVLGWIYLRRTARLIWKVWAPDSSLNTEAEAAIDLLAACVVFSNYFLWHFSQGHVTFILIHLAFALTYYSIKLVYEKIDLRDSVALFLITFSYLTAGFYHSAIFYALPLGCAIIAMYVAALAQGLFRGRRHSIYFVISALAAGIVASLYKTLSVVMYQNLNPRVVRPLPEVINWGGAALLQLIPTFNFHLIGGIPKPEPWGIWETSAFNFLAWLVLITFGILGSRGFIKSFFPKTDTAKTFGRVFPLQVFASVLLAVALSNSLDSDTPLSLHYWVNVVLHGSVRVIGRYQILLIIWLFIASIILLSRNSQLLKYFGRRTRSVLTVLLILNFFSFSNQRWSKFWEVITSPSNPVGHMNTVTIAYERSMTNSHMYAPILNGEIVPNCYNPLNFPVSLMHENFIGKLEHEINQNVPRPRIALVEGTNVQSCIDNTYVTQNDLIIDASCPKDTCLNINFANIHRPPPRNLKISSRNHRWCLDR